MSTQVPGTPEGSDRAIWSNASIGSRRLTWKEKCEHVEKENRKLSDLARIVNDLDRNEHGRHEGDADSFDPSGTSRGNPHVRVGQVFAYSITGARRAYALPPRQERHNPDAWVVDATADADSGTPEDDFPCCAPVTPTPNREELGELLALTDDYDACHERVRDWEALPDWEKEAHPDEEPYGDREDAEWWNRRADTALAHFASRLAEARAEGAAEAAEEIALAAQIAGYAQVAATIRAEYRSAVANEKENN